MNVNKAVYKKWIEGSANTPYNLYDIQSETNNLLKYSSYCQDKYILEELAELYLGALDTLSTSDRYVFTYLPYRRLKHTTYKLRKKHQMWLDDAGMESVLVSSQFLYLISEAIYIIASMEELSEERCIQGIGNGT